MGHASEVLGLELSTEARNPTFFPCMEKKSLVANHLHEKVPSLPISLASSACVTQIRLQQKYAHSLCGLRLSAQGKCAVKVDGASPGN